jgi:multicomponent K+:H+ antiporter subunit G
MMTLVIEWAIAALLVLGGLFGLIGSWGLLRLKDRMQRLHAPTKATTIGIGTALIALAFEVWLIEGRFALREVLVAVFLFATAPLSALFLAKAHLFRDIPPETLPPTGSAAPWASFAANQEEDAVISDQMVKKPPA